jgi:Flp pilus assembly protein TadD
VLHLSDSDNQKFAAAQTPTPPNIAKIAKRNALFSLSYAQAQDGRFGAAVATFQRMLALETDPTLYAGEALILKRCLGLAREVRAGSRTEAQAAARFSKHDCAPG